MNTRLLFTSFSLITTAAFTADLSTVPAESIARKKELLFSDDFESATPAKPWHRVVDTFAFENGTLKGTQTREKDPCQGREICHYRPCRRLRPGDSHEGQCRRMQDTLRRRLDD